MIELADGSRTPIFFCKKEHRKTMLDVGADMNHPEQTN